jgi:hypothetical protein
VAVIFTWDNDLVHVLFNTGLELRGDCEVCSNLCDPKIELEGRELKLHFFFLSISHCFIANFEQKGVVCISFLRDYKKP